LKGFQITDIYFRPRKSTAERDPCGDEFKSVWEWNQSRILRPRCRGIRLVPSHQGRPTKYTPLIRSRILPGHFVVIEKIMFVLCKQVPYKNKKFLKLLNIFGYIIFETLMKEYQIQNRIRSVSKS
jgi:hypothetical protein